MSSAPNSSRPRSLALRYAPFLAIVALQLVLVTVSPSNDSPSTEISQDTATLGQDVSGGQLAEGQTVDSTASGDQSTAASPSAPAAAGGAAAPAAGSTARGA